MQFSFIIFPTFNTPKNISSNIFQEFSIRYNLKAGSRATPACETVHFNTSSSLQKFTSSVIVPNLKKRFIFGMKIDKLYSKLHPK